MQKAQAGHINQEKLEAIKTDFPKFEYFPDNSSRDEPHPDYFQLSYKKIYIGTLHERGHASFWKRPLIDLENGLEKLTRLSSERCKELKERIADAYTLENPGLPCSFEVCLN